MGRILFVLGATAAAGAENQCLYLLDALHARGLPVELAYFRRGNQHERFEDLGIPTHQVAPRLPVSLDWWRRAEIMRRRVGSPAPEIVHTWLYEAHQVGLAAAVRWPRAKLILSHRSSTVYPGARKHLVMIRLLRRHIDEVVANSAAGAEMAIRCFGVASGRVSVISNGMPEQRVRVGSEPAAVRGELGIPADAPLVCSVGRVDHQQAKDYGNLLSAMGEVWSAWPAAHLVVVGPTRDQLESAVGRALRAQVHALGWQPSPADWINAADVLAVSSRTEGHSNVADEALMLGVPVATTDVGGHPALVRETGGRVVPPRRGDLLGRAIIDLLSAPSDAQAVSRLARSRLSMDAVADGYVRTYERVLARRG